MQVLSIVLKINLIIMVHDLNIICKKVLGRPDANSKEWIRFSNHNICESL